MFHEPATVDPALIAWDEAHKGTVTTTELATIVTALDTVGDFHQPVLIMIGEHDLGFHVGSDPSAVVAAERPLLGSRAPSVEAIVIAGGGHVPHSAPGADKCYARAQDWIADVVK